jgi:hypothetical protein
MRINEILTESHLEEGPLLNKVGAGIGKAAGTVAKGVGAVAGGVAGAWDAAKKGFQAGKAQVAGAGDVDPNAAPAGTAPAAGGKQAAPTTAAGINAQGPKGTAPAKTQTGAGAQALQKTAQAAGGDAEKAGQTLYAQVKSQVNQLDKKGKSRIMQLLQKSLQQTPAAAAPAAAPSTTPEPAGLQAGGSAQGQSTAPADPNANAAPPAPGDQRWYNDRAGQWGWKGASGGWVGDEQDIAPKVKARSKNPVNISGNKQVVQPQKQMASKEPKGNMVAESFSIFRKK